MLLIAERIFLGLLIALFAWLNYIQWRDTRRAMKAARETEHVLNRAEIRLRELDAKHQAADATMRAAKGYEASAQAAVTAADRYLETAQRAAGAAKVH